MGFHLSLNKHKPYEDKKSGLDSVIVYNSLRQIERKFFPKKINYRFRSVQYNNQNFRRPPPRPSLSWTPKILESNISWVSGLSYEIREDVLGTVYQSVTPLS